MAHQDRDMYSCTQTLALQHIELLFSVDFSAELFCPMHTAIDRSEPRLPAPIVSSSLNHFHSPPIMGRSSSAGSRAPSGACAGGAAQALGVDVGGHIFGLIPVARGPRLWANVALGLGRCGGFKQAHGCSARGQLYETWRLWVCSGACMEA